MRHALRIVLIASGIAVGGVLLAAGMGMKIDPEWGSSTAHQPIRVLAGTVRTCVDLYLRRAPRRPLSIVISGHQLRVIGAPRC
jgi:hypothetical protein